MKAKEVGWSRPATTVRTPSPGAVIEGVADCAATGSASCTELFEGNGSCSKALTAVVVLRSPAFGVRMMKSTAAPCPVGSVPSAQSYPTFATPVVSWQRSPFVPLRNDVSPAGRVTTSRTDCAEAGPLLKTLTVYLMSAFTCAGLGETVCVTERSASVCAATPRPTCVVCASAPLVAVRSKVCGPVGVAGGVLTKNLTGRGAGLSMLTPGGVNVA